MHNRTPMAGGSGHPHHYASAKLLGYAKKFRAETRAALTFCLIALGLVSAAGAETSEIRNVGVDRLTSTTALDAPVDEFGVGDVTAFTLINADVDAPIAAFDPLFDGAKIDLESLPTQNLNVRAETNGAVGSVTFDLTGAESLNATENAAPYALFGDIGGDFNPWSPLIGSYSLTARSHELAGGGGQAGTDWTVGFEFVNGPGGPDPQDGDGSVEVRGIRQRWHPVTIDLSGPGARETSTPNPFFDERLDVLFVAPSGRRIVVPGFFAGDGAGDGAGNRWHAILSPDEVGTWTFRTAFRAGDGVAVEPVGTGTPVPPYDGVTGTFDVVESQAGGQDLRAASRGLIKPRGGHYLTTSNRKPWLKVGPDIPENFLGYEGFDNTPDAGHAFAAHVIDWRPGDPDWNNGDGRAIIGALNFIGDRNANSIYFLPMNIDGDGDDTFPTIGEFEKLRYDLSKLEQWEAVFSHFLHFVLAETEAGNEEYHDDGELGPERKLFYRMLVARFGHHNGLEWNLGEENDYGTARLEEFAAFIKSIDPYDHPLTTHTKGNQYDNYYEPLLGNADFDITSFQGSNSGTSMFDLIIEWRERSAKAGVPWAISFDEPQKIENDPDDVNDGYPHGRRDKMWPALMAGGAGFEWYVQQDGGGNSFDQQIDDFGLMETALTWSGHARKFLERLPLEAMISDRTIADSAAGGNTYARYREDTVYAIYNDRNGGAFTLDLSSVPPDALFRIFWFDPRTGDVVDGSIVEVNGGDVVDLGSAPYSLDDDWACLVARR